VRQFPLWQLQGYARCGSPEEWLASWPDVDIMSIRSWRRAEQMKSQSANCILCGLTAATQESALSSDMQVICKRCGTYIVGSDLRAFPFDAGELAPYLRAATRQSSDAGSVLTLNQDNWHYLAEAHRNTWISIKLRKCVEYIAARSKPGETVRPQWEFDYPILDASGEHECQFLLNECIRRGYIAPEIQPGTGHDRSGVYWLTVNGWELIEPHFALGGIPGRCFVAMSFQSDLDDAYQIAIKPAIQDCGFTPICMREIPTNEGITDRILSEIRLAQFIVADFTGQRGGVYFEAGFARGLGREVIWSCRKDELSKVHFDTKHLGHVVWTDVKDLRARLAESIRANIVPKR
jgi:hypothetical protein